MLTLQLGSCIDCGLTLLLPALQDCGSCWAFAATAAIESKYQITTGRRLDLSEQQLIDCTAQASGCDGGSAHHALQYVQDSGGQLTEAARPYQSTQGACQVDSSSLAALPEGEVARILSAPGYERIPTSSATALMAVRRRAEGLGMLDDACIRFLPPACGRLKALTSLSHIMLAGCGQAACGHRNGCGELQRASL